VCVWFFDWLYFYLFTDYLRRACPLLPYKVMRRTEVRPYITYLIFAICFGVFFWELTIPRQALMKTFVDVAITSCQVTTQFFHPKTWLDIVRSMFLHGSWSHIFGNMLYLVIFGPSVEEYFGRRRFVIFYMLAGFAAAFTQIGINAATRQLGCAVPGFTEGNIPMIGASGAISGLLGGFILLHPGAKVRAMLPIFGGMGPSFNVPSFLVIGLWFGLQLLYGFLSLSPGSFLTGGVAFWAHIGGFIAGAITVFIATMWMPPPPQNLTHDEV